MSAPSVKSAPKPVAAAKPEKTETKTAKVAKKVEEIVPRASRSQSKSPVKDSKETGKSS